MTMRRFPRRAQPGAAVGYFCSGLVACLYACGGDDLVELPANEPPVVGEVTVAPDHGDRTTEFTCVAAGISDAEGDPVDLAFEWLVDGTPAAGHEAESLPPGVGRRGEAVACRVTPSDAHGTGAAVESAAVVLGNAPPTQPGVVIVPSAPLPSDPLSCQVASVASDPDGDPVSYLFAWSRNGELQADLTTASVPAVRTGAGETWTCTVVASDGSVEGAPHSASVVIGAQALTPTGRFTLSPAVAYSCAVSLVNLSYTYLDFADNGTTLTVTPTMNGGCTMTGSSAAAGNISVGCTYAGTCNETYALQGSFADNQTWTATFSVSFSGVCLSCTNQTWSITGTRQ